MQLVRRFLAWWADHLLVRDAALSLALWVLFYWGSDVVDTTRGWWLLWSLATCYIPLALRRVLPDIAAGLIAVGCISQLLLLDAPLLQDVAVPMILYAVSAYGQPLLRRWWLALALVGAVLAGLDWLGGHVMEAFDFWLVLVGGMMATCLAAFAMGTATRQRLQVVQSLKERNTSLERERDSAARLAVQEERSRIAREMHDIVAHSLSVIVVQADGAAYAAGGRDRTAALAQSQRALETIAETARSALAETRSLVGVLRDPGAPTEYEPQATVAQIGELVERARASGVDVVLEVPGEVPELPLTTQNVLYRVAQEALTNAIRHAGPDATTRIEVAGQADRVVLSVRDDGAGPGDTDGQGHGIMGMRERVLAVGGEFTAGERLGRGFEVRASFPAGRGRGWD